MAAIQYHRTNIMSKWLLMSLLIFPLISHAGIKIIVHKDNNSQITLNDVKRIYLDKIQSFSNGERVVPIIQGDESEVTLKFNTDILKKSTNQLKAYWSKRVFTGKGTPPRVVDSNAETVKLVSNNLNIIGIVSSDTDTSNVTVVMEM